MFFSEVRYVIKFNFRLGDWKFVVLKNEKKKNDLSCKDFKLFICENNLLFFLLYCKFEYILCFG